METMRNLSLSTTDEGWHTQHLMQMPNNYLPIRKHLILFIKGKSLSHFVLANFRQLVKKKVISSTILTTTIQTMGGDRVRIEPSAHVKFKRSFMLWHIYTEGGVLQFIECINGFDENLFVQLAKLWDNRRDGVGGVSFEINEEVEQIK